MRLNLYVADEFKMLEGGKVLAIGLFVDKVVVLNVPEDAPEPDENVPFGVPLGLLLCVLDLTAPSMTVSGTIVSPEGKLTAQFAGGTITGEVGGSANLLVPMDPFVVTKAGKYVITLEFKDGEKLTDSIEIRIAKVAGVRPGKVMRLTPVESPSPRE